MNNRRKWAAGLISLILLVMNFQSALAHESVTVGDYEIEIGWLNEPPITGQQNAIIVNVSDTSNGEALPVEDIPSLTVTISYGGQSKILTLQPLGEETPGQFIAPILPTIPGQYTLILGGKLGDTNVDNVEAEPEEVAPADTLQFPKVAPVDQSTETTTTNWLVYLSLLIGLIAMGLGIMALRKT